MESNKKISIIIAAGGSAERFGQRNLISKQFLLLKNKPLLLYSLEKFLSLKNVVEIVIVTNNVNSTSKLLEEASYPDNVKIKVVEGGKLRQDSVYNGFCNLDTSSNLVVIHDVARPLFEPEDLKKCIDTAFTSGAAVLAVPVIDTIKCAKSDKDRLIVKSTLDRSELFLIQTPQIFRYDLLSMAYEKFRAKSLIPLITDEANMIEVIGESVNLVLGDRKNIKITYPEDLEIANSFLKKVTISSGAF